MRYLITLLLLCSLTACNVEPELLRIGSNRWPGYGPYYLADEQGVLERGHIKLVEYPSTTGVMRAFENGLLDAAFVTLDEALRMASEGLDIRILLVADVSAGADVLYSRPHIKRLKQLEGQRIGVENTALGGYFLSRILDQAGLEEDQVSIVNLPVNEHVSALAGGQVDAVVSFASEEQAMHASGALRLFDSRSLPDAIVDVLVLDREHDDPVTRQRLRDIWYQSLQEWRTKPEAAAALLAGRLGMSEDSLHLTVTQLQMGDPQLNQQFMHNGVLQRQLQQLEDYLLEHGQIRQRPASPLLASQNCKEGAC